MGRFVSLKALLFFLPCCVALADESNDVFSMSLEELMQVKVVTSSAQAESWASAPSHIVVIGAQQIQQRGYRHLMDLLIDLPGFSVQTYSREAFFNVSTWRGIAHNNRFLILRDGFAIGSAGNENIPVAAQFPLLNIDRVEILYGPASAVYGPNAFAGVVNLISSDSANRAQIGWQLGQYDAQRVWLSAADQFAQEWGWQFSLSRQRDADYPFARWYSTDYPSVDLLRNNAVVLAADQRPPYRFAATVATQAELIVQQRERWQLQYSWRDHEASTSFGVRPQFTIFDPDATMHIRQQQAHIEYRWGFADTVQARSAVVANQYEIRSDSYYNNTFSAYQPGYKYAWSRRLGVQQQFSGDWQPWRWQIGFNADRYRIIPATADLTGAYDTSRSVNEQPYFYGNTTIPVVIYDLEFDQHGVFVQFDRELGDDWHLSLGSRFDHHSQYGDSKSPRIGLTWQGSHDWLMKWLYGEAFLAPAPEEAYFNFGTVIDSGNGINSPFFQVPNLDLRAEQLASSEWQTIWQASEPLRLALNLFQTRIKDASGLRANASAIQFLPGVNHNFTRQWLNSNNMTLYGGEVEAFYSHHNDFGEWQWQFSFSQVDGEVSTPSGDNALPYAHQKMFKMALDWQRGDYRLSVRPSYYSEATRQDFVAGQNVELQTVPAYTTLTLHASWQIATQWQAQLTVFNALDRDYHHTGGNGFQTMPSPQPLREWLVAIQWRPSSP